MLARSARMTGIGAILLVVFLAASCSITPAGPGGPASVSFTILGRTVTITFGPVGQIQAEKDQTVTKTGIVRLFDQTPTTRPPTGTMRLLGTDVSTGSAISAKVAARSQTGIPVSGTATVRFFIAPGESATTCTTGTLLASYELEVVAGLISILNDVADLSDAALDAIMANDVTICIEVTANFSGLIIFNQFSFSFGGGEEGAASFVLRNEDIENIHILLPDEVFDDTVNRITPGSVRNVTVDVAIGDVITLRAGRGGTVLDTTDCPEVTGSNYAATAVWDGISVECTAEQSGDGGVTTPPAGTSLQVPIDSPGGVAVAVPSTETYNGIDYAIVGVLGDNTLGAPVSPYPLLVTIDLDSLGLAAVEDIYMAVYSAWVPDLPDGVTLATLTCDYVEGGAPTSLDFTLGTTTAEWSYTRPEHGSIGGVQHDSITVLYSFPTTVDSASEYDGWIYDVSLAMDSSRTLSSCTFTAASSATFPARPLVPEPTWAGTAILGMTLVGPASGTGGGGTGLCTEQADCAADEICTPDGVCIPGDFGGEGEVVQITTDPGNELDPQWDPASETIAFQTDRAPAGTSIRNIGSVQADGSGEGNIAIGPNSGFGVGGPMAWVGTTGLLIVNERVVFHEYMTFDTSQAPFTRTANDGDDAAFTRELFITGGGGGDFITVSRDGGTVLWRFSTSGGSGDASLRVGAFSSLTGQDADATGTALFSDSDPVVQTLKNGAALTPDGSQVVISLPSGSGFDLFLYNASDPPALVRQLTSTGSSSGDNNSSPDISPDGTQVAFARTAVGDDTDLYMVGMDGQGLTQLTFTDRSESEPSWSPDGGRIAFQRADDDGWNIYVLTLGDGVPVVPDEDDPEVINGDFDDDDVTIINSPEAEVMCRTGDIDNLGFGWPAGFDPFSGNTTPVHSYPWTIDPADPAGTDRIMVVSSYVGTPPNGRDGYTNTTSRPDNDVQAITVNCDVTGATVTGAILQIFVDDFQAPVWSASYEVRLDGQRASFLEDIINALAQTGPIGQLISVDIPPEFLSLLSDGSLTLEFDDNTTGAGDGYAVDFVKLLINPGTVARTGTVTGTVVDDTTGLPISGANVSAGGIVETTTNANGEYTLPNVPAGLLVLRASASGFSSQFESENLVAGETAEVDFRLTPGGDCSSDGTCNADCGVSDPDCAEVCAADGFCNVNCSDLDPDPDCSPEPTGEPRCTMRSSFDTGDEGWLILGDAQGGRGEPDFVASGGNPGGYISADDDVQGGVWFFQTPIAYRGNFSGALGKTLTFDLKQSSLSSQFDGIDVSLTGGGLTIVADAGPNPGTDWTSYSIVLDTSAGWTLDALGGTPATQADILAVLTDLTNTLIRGEYVNGADTGGLDNVVLNSDCVGG